MKSFLGDRDLQLQTTFSQNLKSGTYLVLILNPSNIKLGGTGWLSGNILDFLAGLPEVWGSNPASTVDR